MAWTAARSAPSESLRPVNVTIAASFTAEMWEPYLGARCVDAGLLPTLTYAPYNQLLRECLDPASTVRSTRADMIVLLWRLEELMAGALAAGSPGDALARTDEWGDALCTLLAATTAQLIVALPPRPYWPPSGPMGALVGDARVALWHEVCARWNAILAALPEGRIVRFDMDAIIAEVGASRAHSAKLDLLAHAPYSHEAARALGESLARVIVAGLVASRKVLVLDLDNTLWGGVLGEERASGIALGEDAPGNAYVAFQRYLCTLSEQGVMLAIASKNNEGEVWPVIDRHPHMVLRREDIAAWRINWRPKSESLVEIARELNVGLDALVFVDDSGAECLEVSSALPEVAIVHLPEEPSEFIAALAARELFDRAHVVREDRERTHMVRSERERDAVRTSSRTLEDYLRELHLVVRIERVTPAEVPRVAQLINKTNQFNLTTIRRSEEEVARLAQDADWRCYAVWVSDRFGDYGLTGVALVDASCLGASPRTARIDSFLLSCRVLGRGVEDAVLTRIEGDVGDHVTLIAHFLATAKNAPTAEFLPTHGFARDAADPTCFTKELR